MSRISSLLMAAVGVISLSACAPTSGTDTASRAASNLQCFYPYQANNFRGNNQTFYLRSQDKDVFELKTLGYCPEIDFDLTMSFMPAPRLSRLCTGDTSTISMSDQGLRSLCRVQVVKKLTEAEVAALPARDRP